MGPVVNPSPWISHGSPWPKRNQGENIPRARDCLICTKQNAIFFQNAIPGTPQGCPDSSLCFKQLISILIFVTPAVTLRCLRAAPCVTRMNPCGAGREQPTCLPQQCIPEQNPVNFWNKEGLSHPGKAQIKCLLYVLRVLLSNQRCLGPQKETEAAGSGHPSAVRATPLDFWAWAGHSKIQHLGQKAWLCQTESWNSWGCKRRSFEWRHEALTWI